MIEPIILSWSGGKDCSLALQALHADPEFTVVGLLTTVTDGYDRISMHGVRRELLEQQAEALGLPLHIVRIGTGAGNAEYDARMTEMLGRFRRAGIRTVAFGDLYQEDIRAYREGLMEKAGMRALFPIWGSATAPLAERFIGDGFRAIVTCVDTQQLDPSFAGRWFDHSFLEDLPGGTDPCGENGEFHTFACDGPVFSAPVHVTPGETVLRDGRFQYQDLHPA